MERLNYLWKAPFPRFHDEMTFLAYANNEDEARSLILEEMRKYIPNPEECFRVHTINRSVQTVNGIALWLGDPYGR